MSLYVQVPIQQIADGLTAIGWSSVGGGGDATLSYSATAPKTPVNGTLWYDTTATLLKLYTGGIWTTINVSAETISTIQGYLTSAQSAAITADQKLTEFKAIQVTATTLSAGASATASFNSGTGVITLGIPTGATGIRGIQGVAGADGAVMSVAGRTGDVTLTTADIGGLDAALASGGGGFTYMEASNPLVTTNASLNDLWFNTTTMELFICRDATTNENVWESDKGTYIPSAFIGVSGQPIHNEITLPLDSSTATSWTKDNVTVRVKDTPATTYYGYKAFNTDTTWSNGTWATSWNIYTNLPSWIEIETQNYRMCSLFKFMQPPNNDNCVTQLQIQGSNDGVNYTTIVTMSPTMTLDVYQTLSISPAIPYKIYRVNITAKNGVGIGAASIQFIY